MDGNIYYIAWNHSGIKHHFSKFVNILNYVNHLQQSFDDWVVEVYCGDILVDHRVLSEYEYYREEDGHVHQGISHRDYYKCDICPYFECVGCKLLG